MRERVGRQKYSTRQRFRSQRFVSGKPLFWNVRKAGMMQDNGSKCKCFEGRAGILDIYHG